MQNKHQVLKAVGRVLDEAGVERAELGEVVLAGGTSRVPKVRGPSRVWPRSHRNARAQPCMAVLPQECVGQLAHLLGQPNTFLATVTSKLAQKLGQLQPFLHVPPLESMGQLAFFGPT